MKKAVAAVLLPLIFLLTLTACDPARYSPRDGNLTRDVAAVELIVYKNPQQKRFLSWIPNHTKDLLPFHAENTVAVSRLEGERIGAFLRAFEKTSILYQYFRYNSPKDACVRLTYQNGDFLIVDDSYVGVYTQSGEVKEFIGCFGDNAFEDLLREFFGVEGAGVQP